MFLGISWWGGGWAGSSDGNCSLLTWVDGQVGRQIFQQVRIISRLIAISLCVSSSPWIKKRSLLLEFQKIGSQPGNMLSEAKGLLIWLVFLSVQVSQSPSRVSPALCISRRVALTVIVSVLCGTKFMTSSPNLSALGPVLWLLLSKCLWISFRILGLIFRGIIPSRPEFFSPSLLPASKRDLKALVLYCR